VQGEQAESGRRRRWRRRGGRIAKLTSCELFYSGGVRKEKSAVSGI